MAPNCTYQPLDDITLPYLPLADDSNRCGQNESLNTNGNILPTGVLGSIDTEAHSVGAIATLKVWRQYLCWDPLSTASPIPGLPTIGTEVLTPLSFFWQEKKGRNLSKIQSKAEVIDTVSEHDLTALREEKACLLKEKSNLMSSLLFWFSSGIRTQVFDIDYRLDKIDRIIYREQDLKRKALIEEGQALLKRAKSLSES